jgi:hypothetical protein
LRWIVGVAVVALFAAPTVYASVTIGSDLTHTGNMGPINCGGGSPPNCTVSPGAIPGRMVTSPVNGVVTSWSVRLSGPTPQSETFRVIRPLAGTSALFVSSGPPHNNPAPGLNTFPASQPISIGDRIGTDDLNVWVETQGGVSGAVMNEWQASPDGSTQPAPLITQTSREVLMNATVEPTTDVSIATKSRKKGKSTVTVSVPNPGTLSVTSGRTKPALATATAPGEIVLNLRPTKKTRKKLKQKSKLKAALHIAYAASFATPITETATLKLKG